MFNEPEDPDNYYSPGYPPPPIPPPWKKKGAQRKKSRSHLRYFLELFITALIIGVFCWVMSYAVRPLVPPPPIPIDTGFEYTQPDLASATFPAGIKSK